MVFFNYSTMQMAAKIVYYGPGLCGKTTNLQYVYGHTSNDSRGEMVSLETETDRTLFFDLLPIDVGTIGGFKTRIQLYTVPGQVFYNTTRKLVLKGVDGVVFVADSQRPMLQANVEAMANLGENLGEIGLSSQDIPLVLQYNKRDLSDICTVEELNSALNPAHWQSYEAAALKGMGVFETLKGISKLTLLSIKRKMDKSDGTSSGVVAPAPSRARPAPAAAPVSAPSRVARPPAPVFTPVPAPAAIGPAAATATATATPVPQPRPHPQPTPEPRPAVAPPRKQVDILAELEKIRRQATSRDAPAAREAAPQTNGQSEIAREIQRTMTRAEFARARRFSVTLQVEDEARRVVDTFREEVLLDHAEALDKLLLKLNIALHPEG